MNLRERISWGRRAVAELRRIGDQLTRIADILDAATAPSISSQPTFRSHYTDDSRDESDLSYLDDDDRVARERQEAEELRRGGPPVDGFYDGEDRAASPLGPTVTRDSQDETLP